MSYSQKPSPQIFIAGASIAFGIPFLIIELIGLIIDLETYNQNGPFFGAVFMTFYVFGGIVGGALVSRQVEMKNITRAGVTVGLLSYLLQQVVFFLLFGGGMVGDTYTLFALIGGSLGGSLYTRQNRKREERERKKAEEKEAQEES